MDDSPIIIETQSDVSVSIIWLHGLGADGHDFESIVPQLQLPDDPGIRFIFPHAPFRPVTINGGMMMRAWYDIAPGSAHFTDNTDHILESSVQVQSLILTEQKKGITPGHIILAGFSQGGAIALYTGLVLDAPLAGIMVLSAYLPMADSLSEWMIPKNRIVPVFQAHGRQDDVVPMALGEAARDRLQSSGMDVTWHSYAMAHSICPQEISDLSTWLKKVINRAGVADGAA